MAWCSFCLLAGAFVADVGVAIDLDDQLVTVLQTVLLACIGASAVDHFAKKKK